MSFGITMQKTSWSITPGWNALLLPAGNVFYSASYKIMGILDMGVALVHRRQIAYKDPYIAVADSGSSNPAGPAAVAMPGNATMCRRSKRSASKEREDHKHQRTQSEISGCMTEHKMARGTQTLTSGDMPAEPRLILVYLFVVNLVLSCVSVHCWRVLPCLQIIEAQWDPKSLLIWESEPPDHSKLYSGTKLDVKCRHTRCTYINVLLGCCSPGWLINYLLYWLNPLAVIWIPA